ncbi:MAG: biotin/lipoyl-binding protein, partial [Nitrospinota bacterium]
MVTEFKLPELGENIEEAEVIQVLVSEGERVKQDQPLLELETEKATVEVPSPLEGIIKAVHVREGEKVKVGQLLLTLEEQIKAGGAETIPRPTTAAEPLSASPEQADEASPGAEPLAAKEPEEVAEKEAVIPPPAPPRPLIPAGPSVRRLARELGVDLS